jgi:hypothetical protein
MLYPNIPIWVILNITSNLTRKSKSMPNGEAKDKMGLNPKCEKMRREKT